jgi:hypothetical protein
MLLLLTLAAIVACNPPRASPPAEPPPLPGRPGPSAGPADSPGADVVGTNYTHVEFDGCGFEGTPILLSYHRSGVREEARRQLTQMREWGASSIRILVWHMTDSGDHQWGVVSSRGGQLGMRHRQNAADFFSDVATFGFVRLTVSFAPQWSNSPIRDVYDTRKAEENWDFISSVRRLALLHGPTEVRFDLLNEGAPSSHDDDKAFRNTAAYVQFVWRRYASAFGVEDATISAIGPASVIDRGQRLKNLIDILSTENSPPLPNWFDVHANYNAEGVAHALSSVHRTLAGEGLETPIVIGETSYNDSAVADAISAFGAQHGRPVNEVTQWYSSPPRRCNVDPPYEVAAYLSLT